MALPVKSLRDQAGIGNFTSKAALLRAFEKVSLKEKIATNATKKTEMTSENQRRDVKKMDKKENKRRCFTCGQRDHISITYPTKTEGRKCFKCSKCGHIASKYIE
jgi:formate dehydrogenase maturation protein FdhE